MGRYTIAMAETGLESYDHFPGPRAKVNWIVWCWAIMAMMTQFQIGAMYGGVAQVLNQIVPAVPVNAWVLVFAAITLMILLGGGYQRIEGLAMLKVGLFTMLTFLCALLLMRMPQFFSWDRLAEGLKFRIPGAGLARPWRSKRHDRVAIELFMYPTGASRRLCPLYRRRDGSRMACAQGWSRDACGHCARWRSMRLPLWPHLPVRASSSVGLVPAAMTCPGFHI
jgi:hypothetical protein